MFQSRWYLPLAVAAGLALVSAPLAAQSPLTREQALQALNHSSPAHRLEGVIRLADTGTTADADRLVPRLSDEDMTVRQIAVAALWRLWGRSGDAAIDALYEQGVELMQAGNLLKAVQVFSDIIQRKPSFAEGWNKRATAYYMMDLYDQSMKDCDEVLKLNPNHFGALSGYAQMLAERDQPEQALAHLERAYKINPNMVTAPQMIQALRRQIELKRKKST